MLNWTLFWAVVAVVAGGQMLLLHAAWRLRAGAAELAPGVPRSNPYGDIAWTLATALTTAILLGFVFGAIL